MKPLSLLFLSLAFLYAFEPLPKAKNSYILTEENSLHVKSTAIEKSFSTYKKGYFTSHDGYKLFYTIAKVKYEKASIVLVSGRTESLIKYKELIYDLNANGYSVYIMDHRGQGYSEREYKEDRQLGYIKHFSSYVDDMKQFVDNYVKVDQPKKLFALAHSMGGAITSLYIEEYPYDFDAIALTSPMHMPNMITPFLNPLVCTIFEDEKSSIIRYALGQTSYDEKEVPFDENELTHSFIRYKRVLDTYANHPEVKLGGVSSRWAKEACTYSKQSVEDANKIRRDVLVLSASKDKVVDPKAQEKFCDKAGKYCKAYSVKDAYHELLIEKDDYRNPVISVILDFFAKYL